MCSPKNVSRLQLVCHLEPLSRQTNFSRIGACRRKSVLCSTNLAPRKCRPATTAAASAARAVLLLLSRLLCLDSPDIGFERSPSNFSQHFAILLSSAPLIKRYNATIPSSVININRVLINTNSATTPSSVENINRVHVHAAKGNMEPGLILAIRATLSQDTESLEIKTACH